jgi:hypothetical protein
MPERKLELYMERTGVSWENGVRNLMVGIKLYFLILGDKMGSEG